MKREFLTELGIAEDIAAKIMEENGRDIQNVDRKLTTMTGERDTLKGQLDSVQGKLKAFDGTDPEKLNGEITRLSNELTAMQKNHAKELAKMKRQGETKDFMAALKFVNDETREYYSGKLEAALDDDANKGKGRKELLDALTLGADGKKKPNVFAEGEPPPPAPIAPRNPGAPDPHKPDAKTISDKVFGKLTDFMDKKKE